MTTPTPQPAAEPQSAPWQHMAAVREFLQDTLRTNSKDRDDWAEDVQLAVDMLAAPNPQALPELPKPESLLGMFNDGVYRLFTAEQMRAYGLACMKGQQ